MIRESMSRRGLRSGSVQRAGRAFLSRAIYIEPLENRCLLSVSAGSDFLDVPGLGLDPQSFAADRILVRFRDGVDPSGSVSGQQLMTETNLWKVNLGKNGSVGEALSLFRGRSDVVYAYPDYRVQAAEWTTPNDALYVNGNMWGLENNGIYEGGLLDADIDAAAAWRVSRGAGVVIAVIDSGVDYGHPDLKENIWVNELEKAGSAGVDDDGNGYVDDVHGYDFVNTDGDPMDDYGHGTHVAGTIAAMANNYAGTNTGTGVIGVAPEAQIMALKFLDSSGGGNTSDAILALQYAVRMGAKISNNSYGGTGFDQAFLDAVEAATGAGHLFIAAAGNGNRAGRGVNNDSIPYYPASYTPSIDAVISVAASTNRDLYASFSNYGATSVDLAAPGTLIWSTYPWSLDTFDYSLDAHVRMNGTSMATPHVAGAAALVWSVNPGLSALAVKQKLMDTGDPISGRDTVSDRRLNAANAVAAAAPSDAKPSVTITSPKAGAAVAGTITISAAASDDKGVTQVAFYDGSTVIGTDTSSADGWSIGWDTAGDGSHTLTAVATDTIGQTNSHSVAVIVDNINDPPSVAITSPANGATVSGAVTITASASDDRGISQIKFLANGETIGTDTNGSDGWSVVWTTPSTAGQYTLTAEVTDSGGLFSPSAPVTVTVAVIQSGVIAQDDFSVGFTGGTNWVVPPDGWEVSGDASLSSGAVQLRQKTGYIRREADLKGATWTDVKLSFLAKVNSFEKNDKAMVKISTNGSTWTTVKQFTSTNSDNAYHSYEIPLTGSFTRLFVAFDAEMSSTDDLWYIDDVRLTGTSAAAGASAKDAAVPAFLFNQSGRTIAAQAAAPALAQFADEDKDDDGLDELASVEDLF